MFCKRENLLRVLILRLFGALSLSIIYKKIAAVLCPLIRKVIIKSRLNFLHRVFHGEFNQPQYRDIDLILSVDLDSTVFNGLKPITCITLVKVTGQVVFLLNQTQNFACFE